MLERAIAVIPGDGIGGEVLAVGRAVIEAAAARSGAFRVEWTEFPWGCDYYTRHGRMMAADGLEQLRGFDAIYFGAVGWPTVPDHISLWGLRLAICQGLDLWANIRPVTFLPGPARAPISAISSSAGSGRRQKFRVSPMPCSVLCTALRGV